MECMYCNQFFSCPFVGAVDCQSYNPGNPLAEEQEKNEVEEGE